MATVVSPGVVERCPLCNQRSRAYYCKECVRNGTFYHSRMRLPERYADKRLRYLRLRQETDALQKEVERIHTAETRHLLLKEKTEEVKGRIALLHLVLDAAKDNLTKVKIQSKEIERNNSDRKVQLPIFQQRLAKMKTILEQYSKEKIEEKRKQAQQSEVRLKTIVRWSLQEVNRYIFPITEIKPPRSSDSDPSSTAWALAEASQTTYVRGRWVYTDASHETQYRIVEPLLPGSGDYSAYNLAPPSSSSFLSRPRPSPAAVLSLGSGEGEEGGAKEEKGGGFNICAGLTYLAQLVSVLAFYLDATLPKKLCYSDFCKGELNEQQFARRVSQLNANTLYLCLSQGVPPALLRPKHTVANVLALLDTTVADLGRQGSFEVPPVLVESLEEGEGDDTDSEDEEDTDTLSAEWETVPHLPMLETPPMPTLQAHSTLASTTLYSQAMGGAVGGAGPGGLVSSAAASVMSLFRGLGGHHK